MKYLLIILCCLLAATTSDAQMTSKTLAVDSVLYLTPAQEAFMIDKETKSLFKLTPIAGFEWKLSETFSINASVVPRLVVQRYDNSKTKYFDGVDVKSTIEVRNYFKLSRLIQEGKQANNLSSVYYGIGYEHNQASGEIRDLLFDQKRKIYGVLGSQKRFLNYGYWDYGIRIAYENNRFNDEPFFDFGRNVKGVSLSSFTRVGFALGKRYNITDEAKCPIFKCYVDQNSAFKVNLNRDFRIFYGDDFETESDKELSINVNPNIGYELRLGGSPITFDQNLEVNISASTNTEYFFSAKYNAGLRYYYNLNRSIKNGQSGKNLAGWYILARSRFQFISYDDVAFSRSSGNLGRYAGQETFFNLELGIGYQKTLLNNMYFDIDYAFSSGIIKLSAQERNYWQSSSLSFKVGKFF